MGRVVQLVFACWALLAGVAWGATHSVSVDTTALGGATFAVAFDLIDGGAPANGVTVTEFHTDGALGTAAQTGDVSGSLASVLTLSDGFFFNEHYQPISSATGLGFDLDITAHASAAGSLPDRFSFFLIDDSTQLPLFDTTDPTGANALFAIDIDGSVTGVLNVYAAAGGPSPVEWKVSVVPEPSALMLFLAGACLGTIAVLRRRRSRCVA